MSLWRKRQVEELEMQTEKQDTLPETLAVIWYAIIACCSLVIMILIALQPPPVRHNICTIAEISPDITPQERERCRQIRGHKL
jgi:hypothetical protein